MGCQMPFSSWHWKKEVEISWVKRRSDRKRVHRGGREGTLYGDCLGMLRDWDCRSKIQRPLSRDSSKEGKRNLSDREKSLCWSQKFRSWYNLTPTTKNQTNLPCGVEDRWSSNIVSCQGKMMCKNVYARNIWRGAGKKKKDKWGWWQVLVWWMGGAEKEKERNLLAPFFTFWESSKNCQQSVFFFKILEKLSQDCFLFKNPPKTVKSLFSFWESSKTVKSLFRFLRILETGKS